MRDQWTFTFSVGEVLDAAERQMQYHRGRLVYWKNERQDAEASLRETGVEIREHQVTGGTQFTAVLDAEKSAWLNQCNNKVSIHDGLATRFESWWFVFRTRPRGEPLELSHDDVRYFGLTREPRED